MAYRTQSTVTWTVLGNETVVIHGHNFSCVSWLCVRFRAFVAVTMKFSVFLDVMPFSLVDRYKRFGGIFTSILSQSSTLKMEAADFSLSFCTYLPDYTTSQIRRQYLGFSFLCLSPERRLFS
jgi:hypothetical protein